MADSPSNRTLVKTARSTDAQSVTQFSRGGEMVGGETFNSASLTLQLRDTAKQCPNVLTRKMLRDAADDIALRAKAVGDMPSLANVTALNGIVAKAVRIMTTAETSTDDDPNGGAMPAAERLAA